jgi:hypothetical protein
MTSLRQNLQAHRAAASPASCVTTEGRQSALIVSIWQGESWVLPWSQFASARLSGDRIELTFTNVLVTLAGQNLAELMDDIAGFRLSRLRDLPPDYRRKPVEGGPFIHRIEVRALSPGTRDSPG